ncbi:MAG: S8 family peptidase [Spirochaetales bacterium]|nr:S8 family peptidase [Spirochaetales bacterium]
MSDTKNHFLIPEEEVTRLVKTLQARSRPRDISYSAHGEKLSSSLTRIKEIYYEKIEDDSLAPLDLMVFQILLPEKYKIQDQSNLFTSAGLDVKAVKTMNKAVVTTSKSRFEALSEKIDRYIQSGQNRSYLDIVEDFEPYSGVEKHSSGLKKRMAGEEPLPERIDVQLMLLPNLRKDEYEKILVNLNDKLGEKKTSAYELSDGTPVIRATLQPSFLKRFEDDSAIYRIEETRFFRVPSSEPIKLTIDEFHLSDDVDIDSLPIVGILDSGIGFPERLSHLVVERWSPTGLLDGDSNHGTRVASLVVFRNFPSTGGHTIKPRARVIDCNIMDKEGVAEDVFIKRIQEACNKYASICKIFNLSANSDQPINSDEMSILGYELDELQLSTGCLFVVSSGNHELWRLGWSLEEILDNDDSVISSPADSMLSVVVGAVVGEDHEHSISQKDQIAPYSRRGPGFRGFSKPDMTAYAGTILRRGNTPVDEYSLSMCRTGVISPQRGTSFSAPIISGDLAEILETAQNNPLLAKALLYHNARPLWSEKEMNDKKLREMRNLYGRGISDVQGCKFSSDHRVTFLRTGSLNRTTKERVTFYMPSVLANQRGRNVAKVTVTCLSQPPVDRTKGTEYVGAFIRASLRKTGDSEKNLKTVQPMFKEGRQKWDVCCQFSKLFTTFNGGDWQVWLELFSRWQDKDRDVPYALVVSIEDMKGENNIYQEIQLQNRFKEMVPVRARAQAIV